MTKQRMSLKGVFPPIPTPFDDGGDVDLGALQSNLGRWDDFGLAGYAVLGSNGEGVFLDDGEKLRVWRAARQATAKLIIAGTGCESTRQTIALTRAAADAGADVALAVTPSYYDGKMTPDGLVRHYHTLAEASPIPVMAYAVPKFTHVHVNAATFARIAQHPNIIGAKESSGNVNLLGEMVRRTGPEFQAIAGTGGAFFASLALGAAGGVLALANVAAQQCVDMQSLFEAGRWAEAAELQRRMLPVNNAVTATFGIAGLKAALDMLGYYGGPVRLPLVDLSQPERETLRGILTEGGLL